MSSRRTYKKTTTVSLFQIVVKLFVDTKFSQYTFLKHFRQTFTLNRFMNTTM